MITIKHRFSGVTLCEFDVETVKHAAIESYKADLLKGVGKPVLYAEFAEDGGWLGAASECADHLEEPHALFTSYQVAAAIIKATEPLDKPIDTALAAEIERTDWTPEEALQFYADQRNFDIVGGHARIIDNGAVASNALKHLSIDRLELKGDAELAELRAQLAAAQEEINRPPAIDAYETYMADDEESNPVERLRFFLSLALKGQDWIDVEKFIDDVSNHIAKAEQLLQVAQGRCDELEEKLAKAEQRVAEACSALCNQQAERDYEHQKTGNQCDDYISGYGDGSGDCANSIDRGEWRKFVKEKV